MGYRRWLRKSGDIHIPPPLLAHMSIDDSLEQLLPEIKRLQRQRTKKYFQRQAQKRQKKAPTKR